MHIHHVSSCATAGETKCHLTSTIVTRGGTGRRVRNCTRSISCIHTYIPTTPGFFEKSSKPQRFELSELEGQWSYIRTMWGSRASWSITSNIRQRESTQDKCETTSERTGTAGSSLTCRQPLRLSPTPYPPSNSCNSSVSLAEAPQLPLKWSAVLNFNDAPIRTLSPSKYPCMFDKHLRCSPPWPSLSFSEIWNFMELLLCSRLSRNHPIWGTKAAGDNH